MLLFVLISTCDNAKGKKFRPDVNVVHVRDLNFVLQSEIFVHYDGQLQASYLILECTPIYTSYQVLGQALTASSLLLSYIDVRHKHFFLPRLTVGQARDLGPWLIRVGSLVSVRDKFADTIFHSQAEHTLVEQPPVIQVAEQAEAESVDSSGAKAEDPSDTMVVRRTITTDHFLPSGQPAIQQVPPPP